MSPGGRPHQPAARTTAAGRLVHASEPVDALEAQLVVQYRPILDVARGVAAGYQTQVSSAGDGELDLTRPWPLSNDTDGQLTVATVRTSLAALGTLPPNTFLSIPVPVELIGLDRVRRALMTGRRGSDRPLSGVVLDLVGPIDSDNRDQLLETVAPLRTAGAMICVGGYGAPQPELSSILGLRPSIIRLGRDWVRGVDTSPAKRSALETIGGMADQLDAWILVEGVATADELAALAALGVPLAQGSFVGESQTVWPGIASTALPVAPEVGPTHIDGTLRTLVQPARTASNAATVTAVLPGSVNVGIVVVLDDDGRATTVIEHDGTDRWGAWEAMTVNVNTPVGDVVLRALTRPRSSRFAPVVCIDDLGRMLGVLRMERLIMHMARRDAAAPPSPA